MFSYFEHIRGRVALVADPRNPSLGLEYNNREVKQNFLSNVPAANSRPNYFGISPSYWRNLFRTGCATSCVTGLLNLLNRLWQLRGSARLHKLLKKRFLRIWAKVDRLPNKLCLYNKQKLDSYSNSICDFTIIIYRECVTQYYFNLILN